MTPKEKYIALCNSGDYYVPLFLQPWWMDAVCEGKQWDVLLAEDGDTVVAAMPFLHGKKLGMEYVLNPQLTPWAGPWMHPSLGEKDRYAAVDRLAAELRKRNPVLCKLCLMPGVDLWDFFLIRGFDGVTRHTYCFPSLADPEALYRASSRLRRRYDKSVEELCEVDTGLTVDEFVPFHIDYYRRRGMRDLIPEPLMRRVVTTACDRGQGLLRGLRERKSRRLHAAWFVAYDERCSWSLLLARCANDHRGSMSYLVWQVLRELSGRTQSFDFEGGMDPELAFFYSSFGTVETPYKCVYRSRIPFGKLLLHI